ncbi:MAG TPA: DUF4432 family protein [Anaerolineae bacterium]|nr:DUF4432 family protein [Anaerolineae bacterium]
MPWQTEINLQPYFFTDAEKTLAEFEGLTASIFRYRTGVCALRLSNQLGQLILLPYQGQQIWDAQFYGRTLTMKSMFSEPYPTTDYLRTYGGFLLHCGATAMGVPTEADTHALHGELPNAAYQSAQLLIGQDERGSYLGLTGEFRYTVAFSHNYIAQPWVKLYANSGRIPVSLDVRNLKKSPMEVMYLAHVNFRPVDHGRLVYSAPCDPTHVRVRRSIPSHISPPPGYRELLEDLAIQPEKHNILTPDLAFDPEVVFLIDYLADAAGWAHTMQIHPDGSADFISHRPAQLDHGVRWISRTADQDALGMNEPATAEPEGYTAEKAKGNLKVIPAGGVFHIDLELGALPAEAAREMEVMVTEILS